MRLAKPLSPVASHLFDPHDTPKHDDVSGVYFKGTQLAPPSELYVIVVVSDTPPATIIFLETVVLGGAYVFGPVI